MPGDRLAFAVLVRREQELVGVLELLLQLADLGLLVGVDDVERLEVGVDRDAHRPVLGALLLGHVAGAIREVADVADARLDVVSGAEIARDGLRLRGALDDHKLLRHGAGHVSYALGYSSYGAPAEPGLHPRGSAQLAAALRPLPAPRARPRASARRRRTCSPRTTIRTSTRGRSVCRSSRARYLRFMAKSELFWTPFKQFATAAGAFPVRRGEHDTAALETAAQLCREGHIVVMFPEGTRRKKGMRKKYEARAHTGAARIALEAGVPLVPAGIVGTDRLGRLAGCVSPTGRRSSSTTSRAARMRRRSRPSG